MRRVLASLAALGLLAALVPTAFAGAPYRTEVHATSVYCDFLEGAAGTVFLGVSVDDVTGVDGYLDAWAGEPFEGPADLSRDWDNAVTGSATPSSLQATIPLVDANGDPAGTAEVAANLEAMGEPGEGWRYRDGNHVSRATGTFQALSVSGTLTIGSAVYDLSVGCYGDRTDAVFFDTNPDASVANYRERSAGCDITDGANSGSVWFYFEDQDFWVDFFVFDGPAAPLAGFGFGTLLGGAGTAPLELYDWDTGEPVAGSGTVDVSFTTGDRYSYTLRNGTVKQTVSGDLLDVEGSLVIDGIASFDLGSCIGFDGRTKLVATSPNGPKAGGKVPANDLPSGATTLRVPSRATIATKGASPDAEVSYACMTFEEEGEVFEIPVMHTVWYKVAGTGGTVTFDTAGSDFDTVAAAYTPDGSGGFTPVADSCVDDVPLEPFGRSLQSAISFETVAGAWYYVQVGGYPDEMPYGTLKVAVR